MTRLETRRRQRSLVRASLILDGHGQLEDQLTDQAIDRVVDYCESDVEIAVDALSMARRPAWLEQLLEGA